MRGVFKSAVIAAFLSITGLGCQNAMLAENKDLRSQNLELQNRLDEASRMQAAQASQVVTPAPATYTPAPKPDPTPMPDLTPAPAPTPAHAPDLGFEVTQDSVAGTTTVNLPSDIFFSSGQAVLLPDAKVALSKVVAALKRQYAHKPVHIEGHTDSDPIVKSHWKSNKELSEKRAEAVRDYLISKGIDSDRFTTDGLGDTEPKSKTDKAKNRRVELVVMTR